jgi:hypothetical protein
MRRLSRKDTPTTHPDLLQAAQRAAHMHRCQHTTCRHFPAKIIRRSILDCMGAPAPTDNTLRCTWHHAGQPGHQDVKSLQEKGPIESYALPELQTQATREARHVCGSTQQALQPASSCARHQQAAHAARARPQPTQRYWLEPGPVSGNASNVAGNHHMQPNLERNKHETNPPCPDQLS